MARESESNWEVRLRFRAASLGAADIRRALDEIKNLRKEIERYRLLLPGLSNATAKFVANCTKCGSEFLCKIGAASMLCEACPDNQTAQKTKEI